uniref:Uncharacterized protein n=1 Tax=Myoviridae sp. ctwwN25 TaxID=2825209 RepID=A0A8S5PP42_9CAUD|nr:MAG TPA: hypothetical protein [Myoviridae sp. ctwwN25]DAR38447.1 MAG TPA: hypothetical protein [Caudoviricetes sp.]
MFVLISFFLLANVHPIIFITPINYRRIFKKCIPRSRPNSSVCERK